MYAGHMAAAPQPVSDGRKSHQFIPARWRNEIPDAGWIDADDYDRLASYCVVPGQVDRRPRTALEQSWRRLCAAVLLDAALSLRRPYPGRPDAAQAARREAAAWLMAPDVPVAVN